MLIWTAKCGSNTAHELFKLSFIKHTLALVALREKLGDFLNDLLPVITYVLDLVPLETLGVKEVQACLALEDLVCMLLDK